jgi:hypothetical protein
MAASPESKAQTGDDGSRHDQNQEEAYDVVPKRYVAAADRARCEKMPEEANHNEYCTQPNPSAASCACGSGYARRFHCTSVGQIGRP